MSAGMIPVNGPFDEATATMSAAHELQPHPTVFLFAYYNYGPQGSYDKVIRAAMEKYNAEYIGAGSWVIPEENFDRDIQFEIKREFVDDAIAEIKKLGFRAEMKELSRELILMREVATLTARVKELEAGLAEMIPVVDRYLKEGMVAGSPYHTTVSAMRSRARALLAQGIG